MKTLLFLLFISVVSVSCTPKENHDNVLDINIENYSASGAAYSEFSLIPLETRDDCLLSNDISKVAMTDKYLYVLSASNPTVFIFDSEGKYVSRLSKGNGPHEILTITDFCIYNNHLYVLDFYRAIKEFDEKGQFIRQMKMLDGVAFALDFLPEGTLMTFDSNMNKKSDYHIQVHREDSSSCNFLPKDKRLQAVFLINRFLVQQKYVTWPLSNIIYKSNVDSVNPYIRINFPSRNMWNDNKVYTQEELSNYSDEKQVRWIKDFMEIDEGSYFFGFKKDKDYFVKYFNGKVELYEKLLADFPTIKTGAVGESANSLIYTVGADEIANYYGDENTTIPTFVSEKVAHINEDDNPVVVIVAVK